VAKQASEKMVSSGRIEGARLLAVPENTSGFSLMSLTFASCAWVEKTFPQAVWPCVPIEIASNPSKRPAAPIF
jgi:hypothetical protein